MELSAIQYISDKQGRTTGVVLPIALWKEMQKMLENYAEPKPANAWDTLDKMAGSIAAPTDWAAEHDHYLYGTAKLDVSK